MGPKKVLPCLLAAALLPIATAQAPPISKSLSLTLKVKSFAEARDSLMKAAEKAGASVMSSGHRTNAKGASSGWLRLKVRQEESLGLAAAARSLGIVFGEKSEQTAHSSEIEELAARGQRLEEHASRLRSLLSSDRRMRGSDILYLQERLMRSTVDHDLLLLRMKQLSATGTDVSISVALFEPSTVPESQKRGFWGQVQTRAQAGGKQLVQSLVDLVFWLVERAIWLILLIPLYLLGRRIWIGKGMTQKIRGLMAFGSEPTAPAAAAETISAE